ncbi:TPA: GIY-YIG nuclease family protein [Bacillus thuringiensis]
MSRLVKTVFNIELNNIRKYNIWDISGLKSYKKRQGCYVFLDINGKALYIGETNDLWKRVKEHIKGSEQTGAVYKFFHSVKIYEINTTGSHRHRDSYYERKMLEQYLIRKLKPIRNDVKNGLILFQDFKDYTDNKFRTHIKNWKISDRDLYKKAWPGIKL